MSTVSSNNLLHGLCGHRWLRGVYLLGLGLTVLALLQLITALPQLYGYYTAVCDVGCGLTPVHAAMLTAWGMTPAIYALVLLGVIVLFALLWATISGVIFWQTTKSRVAQPFALFVAFSLALVSLCWPTNLLHDTLVIRRDLWSLSAIGLLVLSQVLLIFMLVLLPDGRLSPVWVFVPLTLLTVVGIGGTYLLPLLQATPASAAQRMTIDGAVIAVTMVAVGVQVVKYRREINPSRRRQMRWFLGAVVIIALSALLQQVLLAAFLSRPLLVLGSTLVQSLLGLSLPLAIAAAVLRERLWDLPVFVNRALVYGLLSGCVIAVYVVLVGGLGTLLQATAAPLLALVASGAVALLALPLRDRLQRSVNTLLYGERDDPYAVVARLGLQIERAAEPDLVLHTIVETVAEALKLPYVTISLCEGEAERVAVAYGTETAPTVALPLLYRDELLGELRVAPRGSDHALTERDRTLLAELARQAGVAIQAASLSQERQQSRERIVLAREEERRRLRRDLHDGVGPTLASLSQRIDTASYLVADDPQAAATLLREVKGQVRTTVADIRRVVYDLRPPVLDEWGLLVTLRDYIIPAQAHTGLELRFTAPTALPPLPAAVEVAALRIVQEALANVVRHAGAGHAEVRMAMEQELMLVVEVIDDGRGLPPIHRAGVGLRSMRERTEELGGMFFVGSRAGGGTHVRAAIPFTQ